MNNIQEKIILNNHIDSLCDLYVKGRFYTVILTAKKLLLRYKDSVALLNILGMSNAKINKHEDAINNGENILRRGINSSNKIVNGTPCLSTSGSYSSTSTKKYCYLEILLILKFPKKMMLIS